MPKIKGTDWYTAAAFKGTPIEGSERCNLGIVYGYRRSVGGLSEDEIKAQQKMLSDKGIITRKRISIHNHTDIPAGTPFLEVFDPKSVARLETTLAKKGIEFSSDRFDIYTKSANQLKKGR